MKKEINPEQTNELFLFCHKHFVYHYDVQIELVDHLAASIESQWEKNPELDFNKALLNTFKKFGITGFSKVKAEKEKALRKKYNIVFWNYLKDFYRWPKVLLTIALSLGLFSLFRMVNSINWILVPYFAVLVIGGLIYFYKISPNFFTVKTVPGKKFMLLEQLKQFQLAAILICQLPINMHNVSNYVNLKFSDNLWILFITAFFTVSLNLMLFGYFFYIPKKIKEDFLKQFAEFAV